MPSAGQYSRMHKRGIHSILQSRTVSGSTRFGSIRVQCVENALERT